MRKNIVLHILILLLLLLAVLLSSCARYPETPDPSGRPERTLFVSATMLGAIETQYRYYLAIGIDQKDLSGPVPVNTGGTTGWGTLSNSSPAALPPYFVEYTGGSVNTGIADIYIDGDRVGVPYYFNQVRGEGNTYRLEFEIDLKPIEELIAALPEYDPSKDMRIQINFITRENENAFCRYDSFGVTPHQTPSYISIPLSGGNSYYYGDSEGGDTGGNYEVKYNSSAGIYGAETSTSLEGIDIIEWRVETRKY